MIPFVPMPAFEYGRTDAVSPLIRRVIANNPGPFTFTGTGTYIVGRAGVGAGVAVIDPGPLDEAHLAALLSLSPPIIVSLFIMILYIVYCIGYGFPLLMCGICTL